MTNNGNMEKSRSHGLIYLKSVAWTGNRTLASRVAGENSTTEPSMFSHTLHFHHFDWFQIVHDC